MKKALILLASILGLLSPCMAISGSVYWSSHTATADTTRSLCPSTIPGLFGSTNHAVLNSVCVNTSATTSSVSVYNSNGTAIQPVAIIDSSSKGCETFNVLLSSGITYTTSSTADVTFVYMCY